MLRHAYLIMIHEDSLVLERLIQLLDDENNDFYIHIDKHGSAVDARKLRGLAVKSKIFICKKYKVYWGTNSITNAELYLLKQAVKGKYDYYHILSGADLPIKSKEQILQFFEKNNDGKFTVTVQDGIYCVEGEWLLKILQQCDLDDYESLQYFQRVLHSSGIIDALVEKGIQEGDTVEIYDLEFDFVP